MSLGISIFFIIWKVFKNNKEKMTISLSGVGMEEQIKVVEIVLS